MKSFSEKLFQKSLAYLEVAIISSKAETSVYYNTSEYSNVTAHLLHHSTELFLKFALSASTGKLAKANHKIDELYKEYKKKYLHSDFDLNIETYQNIEYIGFTDEGIEEHKKAYPMDMSLQLRYPTGKKEEIYTPITEFNTDYLEDLQNKFISIYFNIKESNN